MSLRIFKQPDGRYAVFSSVTESFLLEDAEEDEVEEMFSGLRWLKASTLDEKMAAAKSRSYLSAGPQSYEEALERHRS